MEVGMRHVATVLLCASSLLTVTFRAIKFPAVHAQSQLRVGSIRFSDITESAKIKFVHFKGKNGISINREEFGPGVCVADFDGDGISDIITDGTIFVCLNDGCAN